MDWYSTIRKIFDGLDGSAERIGLGCRQPDELVAHPIAILPLLILKFDHAFAVVEYAPAAPEGRIFDEGFLVIRHAHAASGIVSAIAAICSADRPLQYLSATCRHIPM